MGCKVFVDGQEGTTGLKIDEYLSSRRDLDILRIDPEKRKDPQARRELLNEADIAFLCLPDAAARESVSLAAGGRTRIIDASTAFRTDDGWAYGIPELKRDQREKIRRSNRVSVPGCHATGFVMAVYPLVASGVMPRDYPVTCCSLTGYSGGGKKLIRKYEEGSTALSLRSPKPYALKLNHKHLPEMQKHAELSHPPILSPVVAPCFSGMAVSAPLFMRLLAKRISAEGIRDLLADHYGEEPFVRVMPYDSDACLEDGYLNIEECNGTNRIEIFVFGDGDRALLLSRLDNLGKGASGAAIQNMNIMLGVDERTGLKY